MKTNDGKLLLQPVVEHMTKVCLGIDRSPRHPKCGVNRSAFAFLSELALLSLRESTSVEVSKSIYERQIWPSRNGGLEKAFIHWAQADSQVLAFCKIIESRHTFE